MAEPERKMIRGVVINLGGEDYTVPPLNLDQLEEHKEIIDKLGEQQQALAQGGKGIPLIEQYQIQAKLISAALSRNYPEMTVEQVKGILDLGNLLPTMRAVMGRSGLVGEKKAAE